MAGGLGQRHMQADDVRAAQQLAQRRDVTAESGVVAGGVQDLHVEARCSLRDGPTDAAKAHETKGCAVYVAGEVVAEPPAPPEALAQIAFALCRSPGGGKDEEERQVRGGLIEHAGRVADRDAQLGGST